MAKRNYIDPWEVINKLRALVALDYPEYRIGKIELWDPEGLTSWKSKKTRKQWMKEQSEEGQADV